MNLERSLRVGDRLGGHFVQGHVDTTATLRERRPEGEWEFLAFRLDPEWTPNCWSPRARSPSTA